MKQIYIITTAHPYNDGRVTYRIARSFLENGFAVSWFGPAPMREYKPLDGITFHFFKRNHNRLERLIAKVKLEKLLNEFPVADIYLAVDPDSISVANYFAKKFARRSVFDIHEIFHRDMLYNHVPAFLVPLFGWFIKNQVMNSCKKANLVIGVGETRINPFRKVIEKGMVVRHCVPKRYVKEIRASPFEKGKEVLVMQGKVAPQQGTLKLLLAAQKASLKTHVNVKVVLFKIFSDSYKEIDFFSFVEKYGLEQNFILLDPVQYDQVFSILSKCDIGVIGYQRRMGVECMPNRIFEFMAVGLPVIVPTYAIEMQKILAQYNCGLSVDMEDIDDIATGLVALIEDPLEAKKLGQNGLNNYYSDCNWEQEIKELIEWLND